MITDPRTIPQGIRAQRAYAVCIAVAAALFIAPQRTEFATKVALLAALAIACTLRPLFDRYFSDAQSSSARPGTTIPPPLASSHSFVSRVTLAVIMIVAIALLTEPNRNLDIAQTTPTNTASVAEILARRQLVPRIVINNTDLLASRIDQSTANKIGRDVIDDLDIITLAIESQQAQYLRISAAESWLDHLETTIATATAEHYKLDRITISLARRPGQGVPAVMVSLRGIATTIASTRSISDTYEVKYFGGRYVLTTDKIPPGFAPPK